MKNVSYVCDACTLTMKTGEQWDFEVRRGNAVLLEETLHFCNECRNGGKPLQSKAYREFVKQNAEDARFVILEIRKSLI